MQATPHMSTLVTYACCVSMILLLNSCILVDSPITVTLSVHPPSIRLTAIRNADNPKTVEPEPPAPERPVEP